MGHEALPLFVHWEKVIGELLDRTERFPKRVRGSFGARIDNLSLDILERVVVACYARRREKGGALQEVDLGLARLRVLLRLAHRRRYLDHRSVEHLARQLDEAGKMVGGWRRQIGSVEPL